MRPVMILDPGRCVGCRACVAACAVENGQVFPAARPAREGRPATVHLRTWVSWHEQEGRVLSRRFVPSLCQHCEEAPCEPVCPTYASSHNAEGLNAQIYNRCIGTRYCANACPYSVRFFNFFNPTWDKPLHLQLNPDVSVREQGVMEKCTFCIQRINAGKLAAKAEGREPEDGEIQPACVQTCTANALVFGDLNDPDSAVSRLSRSPRGSKLLEDHGTQPKVTYLERESWHDAGNP